MSNTPLLQRLDRLEAYLLEDPQNQALLADAFDTALQAGALERAEFHLRHAVALGHDGSAWTLREAHWLLAQHRWGLVKVQPRRLNSRFNLTREVYHGACRVTWHELKNGELLQQAEDAGYELLLKAAVARCAATS